MTKRNAIVLVADRRLFPVAAFQAFRIKALEPQFGVDTIIASDSQEDLSLARDFGVPFIPVHLDRSVTDRKYIANEKAPHITQAAYYRVFLPKLLASKYRRILHLDVDIYMHGPGVFTLLNLDMGGHAVAAVRDMISHYHDGVREREFGRTISNREGKYLNSGVMLIDPERYASMDLEARILDQISNPNRVTFFDQSAMNCVLDGNWLELSPAFNTFPEFWSSFVREVCPPVIVHFAGKSKPWNGPGFSIRHPMRAELETFFPTTPWKRFLSQFYDVSDALAALRPRGQPLERPAAAASSAPTLRPGAEVTREVVRYLKETRFADVEQGIATLRLDRLPSKAAR